MRFYTRLSSLLSIFLLAELFAGAQLNSCKATLKGDTLTLENNKLRRCFLWNNGALQSVGLYNKMTGVAIAGIALPGKPDIHIPGITGPVEKSAFTTYVVPATSSSYAFLAAEVVIQTGGLEIKRIFRIYEDCPAIVCDYYLRGQKSSWKDSAGFDESLKNIEDAKTRNTAEERMLVADKLAMSGNHWRLKSVEFFDATDYNNNLVATYDRLLYRMDLRLRGNLLLAIDEQKKAGFFMLKEAPVSTIQLYYQGFDYTAKWGEVKAAGLGIASKDLSDGNWVKGYSIVTGVGATEDEAGLLMALRSYQQKQRLYKEERDEMIVANTWGDRSQDSRITEDFILKELEAAGRLGITHFQIDDGWQTGRSSNSAFGGTLTGIWSIPGYWQINKTKFPNGFSKILEAARKQNIQLALWFNPSTDSSFKNWEKDADVLIDQYKSYGIRMWKIDGVQATDKLAEINFRKFLDKVMGATNNEAVFNLDVTAGRRFGYHYMHTYGNLFLENRYTDWGNYYPHSTLRNLWQLARYMPAQRLQIEFLNNGRNKNKYAPDDELAPSNYSFNYLFATTMVAQPLAWFEVSGLPDSAFRTSALIKKYKEIRADLHRGRIFPIGEEPSGMDWTGFQSIQDNKGYLLIFRENNGEAKKAMVTYLPEGKKLKLEAVAGDGRSFTGVTGKGGTITFHLAKPRSFSLYRYTFL